MSAANKRPLSPFMIGPYYKPQMTSILSITHRATGAGLVIGTIPLVYWLVSAARGAGFYEQAQHVLGSMLGQLLLFLWTWSLLYHMANGIRHLFWDMGMGMERAQARRSATVVTVLTVLGAAVVVWQLFGSGAAS